MPETPTFCLAAGTADLKSIDWKLFDERLPPSTDEKNKEYLKQIFEKHDHNSNSYLSLAEMEKLLMETLHYGEPVRRALSKSVARSHRATKGDTKKGENADYVEKVEFGLFCAFLRYDIHCLDMFKQMDTSEDMRISEAEFKELMPKIMVGHKIEVPENMGAEFKVVDRDGKGMVLYDEFADYLLGKRIENPTAEIAALREEAKMKVHHTTETKRNKAELKATKAIKSMTMVGTDSVFGLVPGTVDLKETNWKLFDVKLPLDDSKESKKCIRKIFKQHDQNGNGYLSLAEVQKLLMVVLGYDSDVMRTLSKSVARAHRATKGVRPGGNGDYVELAEFRIFCKFWRYDVHLLEMFKNMDTSEDMRVSKDEFKKLMPKMAVEHGLPVPKDLDAEFKIMDRDGKGMVLYNEFADYMLSHQVNNPTEDILALREEANIPIVQPKAKVPKLKVAQATLPDIKKLMEGSTTVFMLVPGTADVMTNWKLFDEKLPLDESKESKKKLIDIFDRGDANGNRILSLAEIETLLISILGFGEDIRRALSKAVARSHRAAKGVSGKGNDDYVEKQEFRIFCQFLRYDIQCLEMFKLMDTSEDMRLSEEEFLILMPKIAEQNNIPVPKDLSAEFKAMDADGHGIVLYDEFADYMLKEKRNDPSLAVIAVREQAKVKKKKYFKAKPRTFVRDDRGMSMVGTNKVFGLIPGSADLKTTNWKLFDKKVPLSGDEESIARVNKIFESGDANGNGMLSLAETDGLLMRVFGYGMPLRRALRKAIARAHRAAKDQNGHGNRDYIEKSEFLAFFRFLRYDIHCLEMFKLLDTSEDMRIGIEEFTLAMPRIGRKLGIKLPKNLKAEFRIMDSDQSGMVLYEEFADYMMMRKVKHPSSEAKTQNATRTPDKEIADEKKKTPFIFRAIAKMKATAFSVDNFVEISSRWGGKDVKLTEENMIELLEESKMEDSQKSECMKEFYSSSITKTARNFAKEYKRLVSLRALICMQRDRVIALARQPLLDRFQAFCSKADATDLVDSVASVFDMKNDRTVTPTQILRWHKTIFSYSIEEQ